MSIEMKWALLTASGALAMVFIISTIAVLFV
ncbi:hypothetical protein M2366_002944 [Aeromonas sp. BIGb0405]|nr:YnhF family membrane protein [Aeromonas sp. BIGb0405]MCS3456838.1 hypothetical protein [Aeromonas sp. BIGb0405]